MTSMLLASRASSFDDSKSGKVTLDFRFVCVRLRRLSSDRKLLGLSANSSSFGFLTSSVSVVIAAQSFSYAYTILSTASLTPCSFHSFWPWPPTALSAFVHCSLTQANSAPKA